MSAAVVRKSVFALRACWCGGRRPAARRQPGRQCPAACRRPRAAFPRPRAGLHLGRHITTRYRALVLLGAFGGLRWGELAGLRRGRVDMLRSRVTVCETATDIGGKITFGEPKTPKSRRTVPLARSIMREVEQHLGEYVAPGPDALIFTSPTGNPLYRASSGRRCGSRRSRRQGWTGCGSTTSGTPTCR